MFISCAIFCSSWSSDTANKWHALSGISYILSGCCYLFSPLMFGFLVFSLPLSLPLRLPPLLNTRVLWTCPFIRTSVLITRQVSCQVQQLKFFLQTTFQVSRAKPTAWKCGCGKCHSHFSIFKKERACFFTFCCVPLYLRYLAATVGPKIQ